MSQSRIIAPILDVEWEHQRVRVDFNIGVLYLKHGDIAVAFSLELLASLCGCTFEKRGEETLVHFASNEKKEEVSACIRNAYLT